MQGIMDFLIGLGEIIGSLVGFVINLVKDLLYVVGLLGTLIIKIPQMVNWLPSACITLVATTFTIVVIYKVIGREG